MLVVLHLTGKKEEGRPCEYVHVEELRFVRNVRRSVGRNLRNLETIECLLLNEVRAS